MPTRNDADDNLRTLAAGWPNLARVVGRASFLRGVNLQELVIRRALDYLEECAPLVHSVRGVTNRRLADLLSLAQNDVEAFLDKRAELEVVRALHRTFPSDLEWVSETEHGVKPDIRLTVDKTLVSFEVSRLRTSRDEAVAEERRKRIEEAITSRAFPFTVHVFVDVSCTRPAADSAPLIEEAGIRALEFAERLSRSQDKISELARLHCIDESEGKEALQTYLLKQAPDADPYDVLKGALEAGMRTPQAKCEEELVLSGGATGSVTAYYIGTEDGSCSLQVFGRLPDESHVVWSKLIDECPQLPRGGIGVLVLWADRQVDLVDLYSPCGCVTERGVEWKAELEVLFEDYRDRCSAVIFMSGFESELVVNPLAVERLQPQLAESLAQTLKLRTWGYLRLSSEFS